MTQEILLSVKNLSHNYDGKRAVNELSFDIRRGEAVALLGTNGAGKSTTLNLLTGNLKPDAGEILICGHNLATQPKQAKHNLGYLPDIPPLYRELMVKEYLTFAARIHAIEKSKLQTHISRAIELCGLQEVQNKLIANLSRGYQQRIGIAQAILHNPALVILDEPTIGLDPIQMQDIRALLRDLTQNHSVLLSTHLLAEVDTSCDRVLIIDQGALLLDQNLAELNQTPGKRVKLRFNSNPSVEALKELPGCESVSCSQYGQYVCRYSNTEFIQQVQAQALQQNWQLYEIAPLASSLEHVFLDLVMRDSTVADQQGSA